MPYIVLAAALVLVRYLVVVNITCTFALGSSLTIALHTICFARSAYLKEQLNKEKGN